MVAKILLPSFIIKRCTPDEAKRERFHNLTNIYLFIFLWHVVVLFVGCFSLDQCTDMFHGDYDNTGLYCKSFNFALFAFISVLALCITANVTISLWSLYFNKYKRTIREMVDNDDGNPMDDGVYILATLYKESKDEINQLIESTEMDGYKHLLFVFVLDGEYCTQTLFEEVFQYEDYDPDMFYIM